MPYNIPPVKSSLTQACVWHGTAAAAGYVRLTRRCETMRAASPVSVSSSLLSCRLPFHIFNCSQHQAAHAKHEKSVLWIEGCYPEYVMQGRRKYNRGLQENRTGNCSK
jgi:hypothetical protein